MCFVMELFLLRYGQIIYITLLNDYTLQTIKKCGFKATSAVLARFRERLTVNLHFPGRFTVKLALWQKFNNFNNYCGLRLDILDLYT